MRIPFRILSTLAVPALLCAGAVHGAAAAEVTRTLRAQLDAPASGRFTVENLAGTMRVKPGSGRGVVAVATVHAESDDLAASVRFEQVRGPHGEPTLRVRYPLERHSTIRYPRAQPDGARSELGGLLAARIEYDGRKARVSSGDGVLLYADVEVEVPAAGIDARFRNVVGALHAERISGDIRLDTDSGSVTASRLRGEIVADTGSGDVKASDIEGSLSCDTGSGDCEITGFRGESVTCDTGSGNVTLRSVRASGAIAADTGSGDVKGAELEGSFTCDTGSGDCTVEGMRGGEVRCDTGSGNVNLRSVVATGIVADTGSGDVRVEGADVESFYADTGSGEVTLEGAGARLKSITADTGSGSVTLRLGADASFHVLADQGSGDLVNRYSDAQPILEDRELVGYRRGDGRIQIRVDTGSGSLILEPGPSSASRPQKNKPRSR